MILTFIGVPLSVIGTLMHWSSILLFIIYCLTIIALASYMGRATESLAVVAGPRIGGLLNATFGNAVELIISIFALKAGLVGVVFASLTGSVLGNLLLVAGLSFFIGGVKFKRQKFNVFDARHNSGLLMFAVIVAFVIPEVFSMTMGDRDTLTLSIGISIILMVLYLAALCFKLVTHRGVYQHKENHEVPMKRKSLNGGKGRLLRYFYLQHLQLHMCRKTQCIPLKLLQNRLDGLIYLLGLLSLRLWEMLQNMPLLFLWQIKIKWTLQWKLQLVRLCRWLCLLPQYLCLFHSCFQLHATCVYPA